MNAIKYNKGGKLKVSSATKSVPAPSGFHWMVDRGRYFLMKEIINHILVLLKSCLLYTSDAADE